MKPAFIAGPNENLEEFGAYETIAGASLEQVKALLAGAALFVGNDSGPAHMAAAFGVPAVVLFGSSDPEIWAPWRTQSTVLTGPQGIHSLGTLACLARTPSQHRLPASGPRPS